MSTMFVNREMHISSSTLPAHWLSDKKVRVYLPQIYFLPHMATLTLVEWKVRDVFQTLQIGKVLQVNARSPNNANYCYAFVKMQLFQNQHAREFMEDLNRQPFVYICHNAMEQSFYNNLAGYWLATHHYYRRETNRVRLRYKESKEALSPFTSSGDMMELPCLSSYPVALPPCHLLPPTEIKTTIAMAVLGPGNFVVPVQVIDKASLELWPQPLQTAFTTACQQSISSLSLALSPTTTVADSPSPPLSPLLSFLSSSPASSSASGSDREEDEPEEKEDWTSETNYLPSDLFSALG